MKKRNLIHICFVIFGVLPATAGGIKNKAKISFQERALQKSQLKPDPLFPATMITHLKSRWEVLKLVRRQFNDEQFKEMRLLADRYKIDLRKKINIGMTKNQELAFLDHRILFRVGKDSKSFEFNGKNFRWNKNQSLTDLHRALVQSLPSGKSAGAFDPLLFSAAHARISAQESIGYDMMVALAAQDFFMAGDGELMYDLMAGDADLVSLAARLNQNQGTFQFRCNENGMDLKFSDGTLTQYTFTGEGESFSSNLTETNDSWWRTHDVTGFSRGKTNQAYFYVCQKTFYDSGLQLGEWSSAVPTGRILGNPGQWGSGGTTSTQ